MSDFNANLSALGFAKREAKTEQRGPEATYILLTVPENPRSEFDIRTTPVRCYEDEIPAAVAQIGQGELVGVLQKSMLQNLIKQIDEFDAENGFLPGETGDSA